MAADRALLRRVLANLSNAQAVDDDPRLRVGVNIDGALYDTLATVQLDTHFVEAGKIGEVLISRPHVVRSTRSLIFIPTEVTVDKRCIAMASGVFKILKSEG